MTITIRPCTHEDAPALALIAQTTFFETFAEVVAREPMIAHCRDALGVAAHEAWIAEPDARLWLAALSHNATPVGYAGLAAPDIVGVALLPGDIELKRIYVMAPYLNRPIGVLLLQAALAEAAAMGKRRMLLAVYATNARALAFYRKHGFTQIGAKPYIVGGAPYELLIFARPL
ncbi:MAG: GNAT family N-acetyltransferase [Terricaulis sp.]